MTTTLTRNPRRVLVDRTNRALNPSVRSTLNGWSTYAGANGTSATSRVAGVGPVAGVTTYARQSWINASTNYGDWIVGADKSQGVTWARGLTLSFSMYVRNTIAMPGARLIAEFYDGGDAMLGAANLGATVNIAANAWGRLSVSAAVPATAVYAIVRARSGVPQGAGSILDATALLIEVGPAIGSYFDGSFANVPPGLIYAYTGVADASTSTVGHYDPSDVVTAALKLGHVIPRRSGNTIVDVPGGDPVVSYQPALRRAGRIQLLLADGAAADAADALLAQAAAFVLTDTDRPSAGMTFALDESGYDIELDAKTLQRFIATINYREVAP